MRNMLLESARPHHIPLGSIVVSTVMHLLLGVPAWQGVVPVRGVVKPESFITRALFLPPPDRYRAAGPQGERLSWAAVGAAAGTTVPVPDVPLPGTLMGSGGTGSLVRQVAEQVDAADGAALLTTGNDTAYSVFDVDQTVTRFADSDGPMYPNAMLAQQMEGVVHVRYVVENSGWVDTSTAQVLSSTHPQFTQAVMVALSRMRFTPATIARQPVSQLVEQEFAFRIEKPAGRDTAALLESRP